MANNLYTLSKVKWEAQQSLIRTLAHKHRISIKKTYKKFGGDLNGYKVIQVQVNREGKEPLTTHFGAIPLKRNLFTTKIIDEVYYYHIWNTRSELIERLLAKKCEMCGRIGNIEVHHVRKLKDVIKQGNKEPAWAKRMAHIRRKTLMTCKRCHSAIHAGKHLKDWDKWKNLLESRVH